MKPNALLTSSTWRIDFVGAAICAALTLMALAAIVYPYFQSKSAFVTQQQELAAKRQKAQEAAHNLASLRTEFTKLQELTAANPIQLQSGQSSNRRLADLTQLAGQARLDVREMRTGAATVDRRFEMIPVHLAGTGSFPDCALFLNRLRQDFPDTGIRSLELADNPSDPAAPTNFKFDLVWYAAPALTSAEK